MCLHVGIVLTLPCKRVNDIASFKKDVVSEHPPPSSLHVLCSDPDQRLNMDLNIINLARKGRQGLSTQQAMDEVGHMMDNCYQRWYQALANMPVWGEKIDREVLRFISVCRDVALGNLHWRYVRVLSFPLSSHLRSRLTAAASGPVDIWVGHRVWKSERTGFCESCLAWNRDWPRWIRSALISPGYTHRYASRSMLRRVANGIPSSDTGLNGTMAGPKLPPQV